jgi:hypothetical protein
LPHVPHECNPPARLPGGVPAGSEGERTQHNGAHATVHAPIIAEEI